jgi:hypothetical protein
VGPALYRDLSLFGFDNRRGKYTMAWSDLESTDIVALTGMVNDSGNVVTLTGERRDAAGAKVETLKVVLRTFDGNYRSMEVWRQRGSAKPVKVREILYGRAP